MCFSTEPNKERGRDCSQIIQICFVQSIKTARLMRFNKREFEQSKRSSGRCSVFFELTTIGNIR